MRDVVSVLVSANAQTHTLAPSPPTLALILTPTLTLTLALTLAPTLTLALIIALAPTACLCRELGEEQPRRLLHRQKHHTRHQAAVVSGGSIPTLVVGAGKQRQHNLCPHWRRVLWDVVGYWTGVRRSEITD